VARGADAGRLPLYRKAHSYGEYVFDWAWANAYEQHGLRYYPKGLTGGAVHAGAGPAPAGARRESRRVLVEGLLQACKQQKLSSLHLLFCPRCRRAGLRAPPA
jgi:predicted N-acyltransferase